MRYYSIAHSLNDERPYIEAEATDPLILEDKSEALSREQIQEDPALREALDAWERKDDSRQAIAHASWIIENYGPGIVTGAEDCLEGVKLAEGVKDPWCEALRQALPHMEEAAAIIQPQLTAVLKRLKERGEEARAELAEASAPKSV